MDEMYVRRVVVFGFAIVYWLGVWVQARRIRRRIGRSPNLKPRGPKERLLWAGWALVIVVWMFQPFWAGANQTCIFCRLHSSFLMPSSFVIGSLLTVAGYVGTLWCYGAMGDAWRIGVSQTETTTLVTRGPYRFVRHPIYLFQLVMLAGAACLLPTWLSLLILAVHFACVQVKAADEESYLLAVHGQSYRDYLARTGRLFPKFYRAPKTG